MIEISLFAAFIAGLITFLAPCTLPLVPGYLGFISGVSSEDLNDPKKAKKLRWKIFFNGVFFTIGFSVIFIILGTLIGLLGSVLVPYQIWLNRIGGIFIIFFGLLLINVINLPFLHFDRRIKLPTWLERGKPSSSLIIGSAFAVGWTPCVGAILGAVLALAVTEPSTAFFLLLSYSLGLGIPFLLVGLFTNQAQNLINKAGKWITYANYVFGVILIAIGVFVFTNQLSRIANFPIASKILISLNVGGVGLGTSLNLGIAFFAGLLSFLSPSVLPLIPAFLAYLASTVVKDKKSEK